MSYTPSAGNRLDRLMDAIDSVNEHAAALKQCGVSVQISLNGPDYGDQLALRIEGDPRAPPKDDL